MDWDIGHYEQMALELGPVAKHVVSLANLQRGERVVDLATGTGNAALLAAGAGALATGVDTAPRLIDVARSRAEAEGVDASFVVGDIQALPFDDGSFEVALSVFGLIFAADPSRAFDEMIRVLGPAGRALFSVWVPAGPISAIGRHVRPRRRRCYRTQATPLRLARRRCGRPARRRPSRPPPDPRSTALHHRRVTRGLPRSERAATSGEHRRPSRARARRHLQPSTQRSARHPARGQRRSASVPCLEPVPRDRGPPLGLTARRATRRAPAIRAASSIGSTCRPLSRDDRRCVEACARLRCARLHDAIALECDGRALGVRRQEPVRPSFSQAIERPSADRPARVQSSSNRRFLVPARWEHARERHVHVGKKQLAMNGKVRPVAL